MCMSRECCFSNGRCISGRGDRYGTGADQRGCGRIVDGSGQLCLSSVPEEVSLGEERQRRSETDRRDLRGRDVPRRRADRGAALCLHTVKKTALVVFSYVPDSVLSKGLGPVFLVLTAIYILVILLAAVLSIYFSRRFTKPIQVIGKAMTEFDGSHFDRLIDLHTNTELDEIGHSYNEMLGNIQRLLEEIKAQERELRTTELNMLISQINPHFLYNTLDTIYMLARINKEETTMRMIQALSKYLRLSLAKGQEIVTVEDELENVKSYMEIQQIRNKDLFSYEVDCQVDASETFCAEADPAAFSRKFGKIWFPGYFRRRLIGSVYIWRKTSCI